MTVTFLLLPTLYQPFINSPYAPLLEGGLPALSRRHTCDRRVLQVAPQGHGAAAPREHKLRKVTD